MKKNAIYAEVPGVLSYVEYDLKRAQEEMKELVSGGTPPIVGACVTCASCNLVCPTQANPFDLLNRRQEETGASAFPSRPCRILPSSIICRPS